MPKVTIRDVATKAGVSTTTVSHVINETRFVEEDTRAKVLEAIRELGYRVNGAARSLRVGKTQTLALVIPDASNLFFAEFSRKIEDFSFKAGYNLIICNTDNKSGKEAAYLDALVSKRVDGVIFISSGGNPTLLQTLTANEIPVVIADREIPSDLADVVLLDNEQAGFEVTNHLITLGHRVIGCITGPNQLSPSNQRLDGFIRAHKQWGIPYYPELIVSGKFSLASGYSSFDQIWQQDLKPTALFVFSDMMAIGAVNNAYSKGLRIPEDLSVVGFDNIELASVCIPSLTTFDQPVEKMAEVIVDLMVDRIKNKSNRVRRITFRGSLIIRESTASKKERNAEN